MFAPNVVGRAAAITAGWGNLGGGVAQIMNEAKFSPDALAATKVGGKALGRSKAAKIIGAFGLESPEAWA
jgi:hypothetical protein